MTLTIWQLVAFSASIAGFALITILSKDDSQSFVFRVFLEALLMATIALTLEYFFPIQDIQVISLSILFFLAGAIAGESAYSGYVSNRRVACLLLAVLAYLSIFQSDTFTSSIIMSSIALIILAICASKGVLGAGYAKLLATLSLMIATDDLWFYFCVVLIASGLYVLAMQRAVTFRLDRPAAMDATIPVVLVTAYFFSA